MKYIVILGDGMAGYPLPAYANKTCLQLANKPFIDQLAGKSELGLAKTVPEGFAPGSDVANLSVMGYDPARYYTGRSPLEAASIGIALKDTDVTLRCNLVTLSDEARYRDKTMLDYSAGEISTAEARELIDALKAAFDRPPFTLYAGISYRHCLVCDHGETGRVLTPPHDISDRKIAPYLPKGAGSEALLNMMERSYRLLNDHPVNRARRAAGKRPANSVWFWGEGTKPRLTPFWQLYRKHGAVISAVDLIKGIGILAGLKVIEVEGATGNWDTNFYGKACAAADALTGGLDFVYLHMEAPDECGHHGDIAKKIYSIEQIDGVVKTVCDRLTAAGEDFSLLLLPDHPTPIACKTHVADPVPYLLYRSTCSVAGAERYDEAHAAAAGGRVTEGCSLMKKFFNG